MIDHITHEAQARHRIDQRTVRSASRTNRPGDAPASAPRSPRRALARGVRRLADVIDT
ncbi:hypothetical protein [Nocardioides donggukensis]|uniref:Uncharacterized protein n=1 Tax=Nocardioides donggukensis TaxID=2774019 RepID=A0A927K151_9ACTN|nr:hypothetical protein [Nocardioides donggukensis]MBD8868197.1 hypothetical protein [Nocardioides donggukensis]